jgi:hypothetical protein
MLLPTSALHIIDHPRTGHRRLDYAHTLVFSEVLCPLLTFV